MLTSIFTAILTIGLGILAFEYQQRWSKKLALYEELILDISTIADTAESICYQIKNTYNQEQNLNTNYSKIEILKNTNQKLINRSAIYYVILPHQFNMQLRDLMIHINEHLFSFINFYEVINDHKISQYPSVYPQSIKFEELICEVANDFIAKMSTHIEKDLNTKDKLWPRFKASFLKYINVVCEKYKSR